MTKRIKGDTVFDTCVVAFMTLFLLVELYPLYFTVIASFSDPYAVAKGRVYLFPSGFNTAAYKQVFAYTPIWIGYMNTVFYTVCGTALSLSLTLPTAYTLSKKTLPLRGSITMFFLFTMYFSGGMIPSYLLIRSLNLINTRWVLVLVGSFSVYNMVISRVFFMSSIPEEIYEAARIDGASDFNQFFRIALPLAAPLIAVITLYYAVGNWNSYFSAMLYITKRNLEPLQSVLRRVLIMNENAMNEEILNDTLPPGELLDRVRRSYSVYTMKYAMVFIASLPLLVAYPFIQKYFVRGIMIGSLKG